MITDPSRPQLYVADRSAGTITVLNTTSDEIIATLKVGSLPYGLDVSPDGKELYVALRGENALGVINLGNLTVSRKIPLTAQPFDVAAGKQGLVYVTTNENYGYPRVVDTVGNRELGRLASPQIVYESLIRVSHDKTHLYLGNGGGNSYAAIYQLLIQGNNATWQRTADGGSNLGDFAVSPDGSRVYVAAGAPYDVSVFSTSNMSLIGSLHTLNYPNSVGLAQNGRLVFATHASAEVRSFNATNFGLINLYGTSQYAIQARPREDAKKVYVMTGGYYEGDTRYVEVIDTVPDTQPPTWPVGSFLEASSVGVVSANLTWSKATDNVRVAGYLIYENSNLIGNGDQNAIAYQVRGLQPNTSYTFQVQAEDSAGLQTTDGPTTSLRTLADTTPPSWPAGSSLSVYESRPSLIVLTWNVATDDVAVASYRIYRDGGLFDTISVSTWQANQNQYTATSLSPITRYLFKVEAGDTSNNWSTNGPSLNVTTPSLPNATLNGGYIMVRSFYHGTPYPGSSIQIENNFTNVGTWRDQVTGLTISSDLGSWTMSGVPFDLYSGEMKIIYMTVSIPTTASVGNHTVFVTVTWSTYDPQFGTWRFGPNLSFSGTIPVQRTPPTTPNQGVPSLTSILPNASWLLLGAVSYLALVSLATLLVVRDKRRKSQSALGIRKCKRCGTPAMALARFCYNCGADLKYQAI